MSRPGGPVEIETTWCQDGGHMCEASSLLIFATAVFTHDTSPV